MMDKLKITTENLGGQPVDCPAGHRASLVADTAWNSRVSSLFSLCSSLSGWGEWWRPLEWRSPTLSPSCCIIFQCLVNILVLHSNSNPDSWSVLPESKALHNLLPFLSLQNLTPCTFSEGTAACEKWGNSAPMKNIQITSLWWSHFFSWKKTLETSKPLEFF